MRDGLTKHYKNHAFVQYWDEASVDNAMRDGVSLPYEGCMVKAQLGRVPTRPATRRHHQQEQEQEQQIDRSDALSTVQQQDSSWFQNLLALANLNMVAQQQQYNSALAALYPVTPTSSTLSSLSAAYPFNWGQPTLQPTQPFLFGVNSV